MLKVFDISDAEDAEILYNLDWNSIPTASRIISLEVLQPFEMCAAPVTALDSPMPDLSNGDKKHADLSNGDNKHAPEMSNGDTNHVTDWFNMQGRWQRTGKIKVDWTSQFAEKTIWADLMDDDD